MVLGEPCSPDCDFGHDHLLARIESYVQRREEAVENKAADERAREEAQEDQYP